MSRPVTSSWWRNVPCSSAAPARSASPSSSRPRSKPPPAIRRQRLVDVGPDGLRVDAAEVGVALAVQLGDPDPAAGEQPRDPARSRQPYSGSTRTDTSAAAQRVEVHRPARERARSPCTGRTTRRARRPRRPRTVAAPRGGRHWSAIPASTTARMSAPGRGARRRLDLEPVVGPGVVGRGDHDARRGAALDDLVGAHLGRDGGPADRDRDPAGEEHLGGGTRRRTRTRTGGRRRRPRPSPARPVPPRTRRRRRAQRRTLSYVKSSATRARQPSVPNTMRVGAGASARSVTRGPPLPHTGRGAPARAAARRGHPGAGRRAAPRSSYRPAPGRTTSPPGLRWTSRSSSVVSIDCPGEITPPSTGRPSAARSDGQPPRSLQPTSSVAITTRRSRAAPSITA